MALVLAVDNALRADGRSPRTFEAEVVHFFFRVFSAGLAVLPAASDGRAAGGLL
jgi:hypothetical protein